MPLAFGDGGTTLATAESDGATELWDVTTQTQTGAALTVPGSAGVSALAFSPAAGAVATGNGNGSVRLWDVATQQEIGTPMTADAQPVYAVAFGSGDGTLATAGGDGTARVWDVAFPADLLHAACGIADVSFTRQQWDDYAGSQPFQQVCPAG